MSKLEIIEEPYMKDGIIKCNALTALVLAKSIGIKSIDVDGEKVELS